MKTKLLVRDVKDCVENEIAPIYYANPKERNGLEFGSLKSKVNKIVVCWSPTLSIIEKAAELNANLIIAHEWLFYEKSQSRWINREPSKYNKKVNRKRTRLLSQHKISVLKYHSNLDYAPGGIADSFGEYLGFDNLICKKGLARIYKTPPMKLCKFAKFVLENLELSHIRVLGDQNHQISYIGTSIGGLGQIFTYADVFESTNVDVLIFGEILAYSEIYTYESGYSCIITSHEESEMPGLRKFAGVLQKKFPSIEVAFFKSETPSFLLMGKT